MTLLELAKQYESDVETRINCIKTERRYGDANPDDCDDQIMHWKITLAQIRTAIKENS